MYFFVCFFLFLLLFFFWCECGILFTHTWVTNRYFFFCILSLSHHFFPFSHSPQINNWIKIIIYKYHNNIYEKLKSNLNPSYWLSKKEREAMIILENTVQQNNLCVLIKKQNKTGASSGSNPTEHALVALEWDRSPGFRYKWSPSRQHFGKLGSSNSRITWFLLDVVPPPMPHCLDWNLVIIIYNCWLILEGTHCNDSTLD